MLVSESAELLALGIVLLGHLGRSCHGKPEPCPQGTCHNIHIRHGKQSLDQGHSPGGAQLSFLSACASAHLAAMSGPVVFGTTSKVESLLDTNILPRFLALPQFGKVAAEYVWIGGSGSDLRSKTKTLEELPKSVKDLPKWNYDGSSTGQAPGECSRLTSTQQFGGVTEITLAWMLRRG